MNNPKTMKLGAKDWRTLTDEKADEVKKKRPRLPVYFILDDIFDTYNVGGFFRLAEAVAAQKIYLCGQTETPPNQKIKKASVGIYKVIDWEYKKTAGEALSELRKIPNMQIIAIELDKRSKDYRKIDYRFPIAFVFGNENYGMSEDTLKLVDHIAEIPMYGVNISLNAMVAAGIVVYRALDRAMGK